MTMYEIGKLLKDLNLYWAWQISSIYKRLVQGSVSIEDQ